MLSKTTIRPSSVPCSAMDKAAFNGDLEEIKILHYQKKPWSEKTTNWAAFNNHFKILKWLVRKGCPKGDRIVFYGIKRNNYAMVVWALEEKCPYHDHFCKIAAEKSKKEDIRQLFRVGHVQISDAKIYKQEEEEEEEKMYEENTHKL